MKKPFSKVQIFKCREMGPTHLDVSGDVVEAAPLLGGAVQGRRAASRDLKIQISDFRFPNFKDSVQTHCEG
jgi:hypothetical protein